MFFEIKIRLRGPTAGRLFENNFCSATRCGEDAPPRGDSPTRRAEDMQTAVEIATRPSSIASISSGTPWVITVLARSYCLPLENPDRLAAMSRVLVPTSGQLSLCCRSVRWPWRLPTSTSKARPIATLSLGRKSSRRLLHASEPARPRPDPLCDFHRLSLHQDRQDSL